MQASQRLDRFGAEVFASLNNKLLALKAQGKTIYNMSVGTPDFKPYDHVVEALTQAAQDPEMWKYALRDLPELKQAVCDYYERRFGVSGITPSMVQSCNGTQEGVGHLGLALRRLRLNALGMELKDVLAAGQIGQLNGNAAVKAAGT